MESQQPRMDALAIDELLRLVFQHCARPDNFRNALVSKKWSQEALSALWNHLDTPHPLLTLLAPMVEKEGIHVCTPYDQLLRDILTPLETQQEFERPLWSHDWTIFRKYSWRVHRISFLYIETKLYCHSVFTEIALTKPQGDLIPNLRNLVCQPYSLCDFIPLLLNQRLADLTIAGITGTSLSKAKSLLSYLPGRCPTLRHLDLRIFEYDYTEIGLEVLLTPLSSLTELDIAPATLTLLVMHALACLPRLEHIRSTHRWPTRNPNRLPRPPVDTGERFTSLRLLEISTDNVPPFLETYRLDNLRKLVLEANTQQTREEHLRFFEIISQSCPQLETLRLGNRSHDRPSELPLATCETFAPLRRLPRLADLSLIDLPMSTSALLYLAENLPSLTRLDLRRSSTIDGTPAFPISVLSQLAVIRPQLVFLGLCVDTSLPSPAVALEDNERFRYLAELNVGPSRLDSPVLDVATYLSGILPEGCQLTRLFDGWIGDEGESWESWVPVIEMVSALTLDKKASRQAAAS